MVEFSGQLSDILMALQERTCHARHIHVANFLCKCLKAPHAAYRSCSSSVYVTDRAGIQLIGCRLSLRPHTDYDQRAICSPGLPFNGLHPHNPCTNIPTQEGWKAELAWFVDP